MIKQSSSEPKKAQSNFEIGNRNVRVWIDQDSIMLKAKDLKYDDPVELTPQEAMELAKALVNLAGQIDRD